MKSKNFKYKLRIRKKYCNLLMCCFVSVKLQQRSFFARQLLRKCATVVTQKKECRLIHSDIPSDRFFVEVLTTFLLRLLFLHSYGAGAVFVFLNDYVYGMWR